MENFVLILRKLARSKLFLSFVVVLLLVVFIFTLIKPPRDFPSGTTLTVTKGESIKSVSADLKEKRIIRSESLFNLYIQLSQKSTIASGEYLFSKPQSVFEVASRIKNAEYGLPTIMVTLTEGMTNAEIVEELSKKIQSFNKEEFIEKTKVLEGYLFPDTYKFNNNASVDETIALIRENFQQKIKSISQTVDSSKYSLDQIMVMASIIEKESTADGRQEVSNILWKRFEMNMALQVDAPFVYTIGKGSADLTADDLKSDSLYNTYTRTGLIPTAISNPGLDSIVAAAHPQPTQNLYFLTGRDGKMYYAKSFEGHKKNRALYLD